MTRPANGRRLATWQAMAALAALIWAGAVAWGSLTPAAEMPSHLPWDKFNHLLGYAGLTLWLGLASRRWWWSALAALAYGILIEYLQVGVPGRAGGDWADILANTLGALAVGLGATWLGRRRAGAV